MKGKQTSDILFNDHDHMDALTKMSSTYHDYNNNMHYFVGSPTMANQIGVCDEEGNYETVWKKIYDDDSLTKNEFFFFNQQDYFGTQGCGAIVFPRHKCLDPYEQKIAGVIVYDVVCGFAVNAIAYEPSATVIKDLDYFPLYFSINGLTWYEYTGFKKEIASEGKIKNIREIQVSNSGVYITYMVTELNLFRMAYIPFDKEDISFGPVTYFGQNLDNIINVFYDYYDDTGTKPKKGHTTLVMHPLGDDIMGYTKILYYPPGYKYNYGGTKETYYAKFNFIKISPSGEYEEVSTKYYPTFYYNLHTISIPKSLYHDDEKILFLAVEIYTDTRIFELTNDMKMTIVYYEDHKTQYFQTGQGWWNTLNPGLVELFFSYTGAGVQLFGDAFKPFKDRKTGYYYSYAQIPYWNPWFMKPNSEGDRENRFIKGLRTKDFIHYEYFDLPPYRVVANKDNTVRLKISFDSKYPGAISYYGNEHEFPNVTQGWTQYPYGFNPIFTWSPNYGMAGANNQIVESAGIFILVQGTQTYTEEQHNVVGKYVAYFKNYDLTPSDEDCLLNFETYNVDPINNSDAIASYNCRTLLDQLYNI